MKFKLVLTLLILFMCIPTLGFSIEIYNSVYFEGNAPVKIDGELDDWTFIKSDPENIDWRYPTSKPGLPEDDTDLSASFKCFYDSHNLYVAVTVRDDSLVFGQEIFEQSYSDDSVGIYFDGDLKDLSKSGYDSNDGQIRVSMSRSGETVMEGLPMLHITEVKEAHDIFAEHYPFLEMEQYPYIWETLGVKAVMKPRPDGYVLEIMLPYRILGWDTFEPDRKMGMTITVNDDDDGYDRESKIAWAVDPDGTVIYKAEFFNQVAFSKQASLRLDARQGQNSDAGLYTETAEAAKAADELLWVLSNILKEKPETAESILNKYQNRLWAQFLQGRLHFFAGNSEKSIDTLNTFIDNCPDKHVVNWARVKLGIAYEDNKNYSEAREAFETVLESISEDSGSLRFYANITQFAAKMFMHEENYSRAMVRYREIEEQRPDIIFTYIREIVRDNQYDKALDICDYIEQNRVDKAYISRSRLEKARIFFFIGLYDRAAQLAEELHSPKEEPRVDLGARLILYSIESKRKSSTGNN